MDWKARLSFRWARPSACLKHRGPLVWDDQHLDVWTTVWSPWLVLVGNCRVDLEIFNFMSFHGLLVLTPAWLGQMGRIGLGHPNRSPSSRYYLGSQFLFIPAHQSFLQGTCFLRPTLDQCAMVTHGTACASWRSQNCWKWTCGQSIWDSTPTFLWSVGEHQFICTAVTGSLRGSSLRLVFTFLPGGSCFVSLMGGWRGWGWL